MAPERLAWLRGLPDTVDFRLSNRNVRLFHASARGIYHRVRQYDGRDDHLAMFDNTEFTGDGPLPDIVGYGDVHTAYVKTFAQKCLFNAGSVGNPLDLPQACYAILEGRFESAEPGSWAVNLVRLPYDIEESIRQATVSGMPDLEHYANELRTARYRGMTPKPAPVAGLRAGSRLGVLGAPHPSPLPKGARGRCGTAGAKYVPSPLLGERDSAPGGRGSG